MRPSSSAISLSRIACMTGCSFVASFSASSFSWRRTHFTDLIGRPKRRSSTISTGLGLLARALELEADVHEVVGRPGPGVLEVELALEALGDVVHRLVERLGPVALDEERGVHDHVLA